MIKKLKQLIGNMTFERQMFSIYGMTMGIVYALAITAVMVIYNKIIISDAENILSKGVYKVETNVNAIIKRTNEYSKVIMFNNSIQTLLKSDAKIYTRTKMDSIYNIIGSTFIDTIYIYDLEGGRYSAQSGAYMLDETKKITEAPWYEKVMDSNGGMIMIKNDGEFLSDEVGHILFARVINDLDTFEPIGILLMTVPDKELEKSWSYIEQRDGLGIVICDEDGGQLYVSDNVGDNLGAFMEVGRKSSDGKMTVVDYRHKKYGIMRVHFSNSWSVMQILPLSSVGTGYGKIILFFSFMLFGILLIVLIINRYISRRFKNSVESIMESIGAVKQKVFNRIEMRKVNYEINELQKGYNYLMDEIQLLLGEVEKDEKQKRTYELSLLQAQIRPHFLYNTFDAVSALALMNRTDDIFIMMQALGKYYRFSLHKGEEVIPVADELNIIKNYVVIMKYRFDGAFDVIYDVDRNALDCEILKLTLQPFVENAIFHGMKKGIEGVIRICIKKNGDMLVIGVADNGIGMSQEQKEKMIDGKLESKEKGFGVRSTIERLRLYYGIEDFIDIESHEKKGTSIKIRIPARNY